MHEIKNLSLLELRSLFGINKLIHTKDPKTKTKYTRLAIAWMIIIAMTMYYISSLVKGFCSLGLSDIVPSYLVVISTLIILMFGLFNTSYKIFSTKGYDILSSMPIKSSSIVLSRFSNLYIGDLIITLVIMVPGIITYGSIQTTNYSFYLLSLVVTLFIPIIPLVISVLFGTIIYALTSRTKRKNMFQTILMIGVVVGVMILSFTLDGMTNDMTDKEFIDLATLIGNKIQELYPPAIFASKAILNFDLLNLLLFMGLSFLVITIMIIIVSLSFNWIMKQLQSYGAKHNYKIGEMKSKSITKSLLTRELKRYFSSSIYVTNTIIGPIMGTIMTIAIAVVGIDKLTTSLPENTNLVSIIPFVFAAVFCMMTTTSTSISLEGKQFWIVKSMPITSKALFDSKILMNLIIMLPFYIVSTIALIIATTPTIMELAFLIIIPISIILFSVVFGITINLQFYNFDWEREAEVVKQSTSAILGGFIGFFLSFILGVIVFIVPIKYGIIIKTILCLSLFVLTLILYKKNNKVSLINL